MRLFYFGTTFDKAGHHFYELAGSFFNDCSENYSYPSKMPFDPEYLPEQFKNEEEINGRMFYFYLGGHSAIYIVGSCYDHRPGSKSVFFVDGEYSFSAVWNCIRTNKIGREIINRMKEKYELARQDAEHPEKSSQMSA